MIYKLILSISLIYPLIIKIVQCDGICKGIDKKWKFLNKCIIGGFSIVQYAECDDEKYVIKSPSSPSYVRSYFQKSEMFCQELYKYDKKDRDRILLPSTMVPCTTISTDYFYKTCHYTENEKKEVFSYDSDAIEEFIEMNNNKIDSNLCHIYPAMDSDLFEIRSLLHYDSSVQKDIKKLTGIKYLLLLLLKSATIAIMQFHSFNYVHLDIKAENFLYKGDQVYLIDFDFIQPNNSPIEQLLGTIPYISPEVIIATGRRQTLIYGMSSNFKITTEADIFSFGVLCYYMLTGTFFFDSDLITDGKNRTSKHRLYNIQQKKKIEELPHILKYSGNDEIDKKLMTKNATYTSPR
eukprot:GHVR01075763.1.p1 GENE.GHVR01075763.1~~GHVR01075763.1.p1  ORF type:complete len:365 (+),score=41.62 GHVR01075763.1:46-1095(+)